VAAGRRGYFLKNQLKCETSPFFSAAEFIPLLARRGANIKIN